MSSPCCMFGDRGEKWLAVQASVFVTPLLQGQKDDVQERQTFSFHRSRKRVKDLVGKLPLASYFFGYDVMLCFKTWRNSFSVIFVVVFVLNRHWDLLSPCLRPHSLKYQWPNTAELLSLTPAVNLAYTKAQLLLSSKKKNTLIHIGNSPFYFFLPCVGIRENRFFHTIALGLLCDCFSC